MSTLIRKATAALAIGAFLCLPGIVSATPQTTTQNYATSLRPEYQAGSLEGTLKLTTAPDGTISGYYRPADESRQVDVQGGSDGSSIWLNIGTMGQLHIDGKLQGTQIVGATLLNGRTYDFVATPTATHT